MDPSPPPPPPHWGIAENAYLVHQRNLHWPTLYSFLSLFLALYKFSAISLWNPLGSVISLKSCLENTSAHFLKLCSLCSYPWRSPWFGNWFVFPSLGKSACFLNFSVICGFGYKKSCQQDLHQSLAYSLLLPAEGHNKDIISMLQENLFFVLLVALFASPSDVYLLRHIKLLCEFLLAIYFVPKTTNSGQTSQTEGLNSQKYMKAFVMNHQRL